MSGQQFIAGVAAIAIVICVAVFVGFQVYNQLGCTVDVAGTAVEVTASGHNSQMYCRDLVDNTTAEQIYAIDHPDSSKTLMCKLRLPEPYDFNNTDYGGIVLTVRDRGELFLYGNAVCSSYRNEGAVSTT